MTPTEKLVERLRATLPMKAVGKGRHGDTIVEVDLTAIEHQRHEAADALEAKDARIAELEADAESLQLAREIISDMARWGYLSADPDERGYFIGDDVLETIMRRAASARGREDQQ